MKQVAWAKIKVLTGLVPSGGFREESVPCFFQLLWAGSILRFLALLPSVLCLTTTFSPINPLASLM
jgi:hypothetical protein